MDNFTGELNFCGENILRDFLGERIVEQTAKIRTLKNFAAHGNFVA